ncbi:2'-5' RNA ligase family protein [Paludifilum halophilum]|uniref:Putative phosphoesterase CHM34_10040 n=1 Tax=Paludifilum halophilum TaxID=1642702 RepID=A0A235B674_9BACL|nr:2'-5' RNA ligase family protein [Paludifilum halophilum]OYD07793.1 hypothetical protein CHM34_10040 [Paludifilum halophilum]
MKYGIAFFPDKKIQDIANSYRKRYDPHYALIPPHVTLKEAFEMDDEGLSQANSHLEKVSREIAPFLIHFPKLSTFHPTNNVIYIAVEETEAIKSLHEKINSGVLFHERRYAYIPHLTIGQEMPEDELHDVYGSLRMKRFELSTWVDRFHLMYQLENKSWTIYQTYLLRGSSE